MTNILMCGNHVVFDGMLTCLLSVLNRNESKDEFNVFIFTMDVSRIKPAYTPITDAQVVCLDETVKSFNPNSKVTSIDVSGLYEEHFAYGPNDLTPYSPYALIRLFADLVDLPDKVLYLDADLMFNRDIRLLYDIDIDDVEYAAARDHYGKFLIHPNYINSGVLLLNIKKCKETGLLLKARNLLKVKKITFPDQSAIVKSTTKKKMLPQKFNDQKFLHKSTIVRHFSKRLFWFPYPHTDNIKQWHIERVHKVFKYHQFDDIYDQFLDIKKKNNL